MMRQLVTMRHPIAFILFGALVAVLVLYPIRVVDGAEVATSVEGENFDVKPTGTRVVTDAMYHNGQALEFTDTVKATENAVTFSSEGDVVLMARASQSGGSPKLKVGVNGDFTVAPAQAITASMFALLAALVLALAWSPAAHANRRIRAGSCDIFYVDQTDPIAFSAHKALFGYLLVDLALGDVGLTPMHRTGAIGRFRAYRTGSMRDPACQLPRRPLPRTPLNRGLVGRQLALLRGVASVDRSTKLLHQP